MTQTWRSVAAVALLTWMGIHAIRTYLTMVAWVLGGSTVTTAMLFLGLWTAGQLGWPVARLIGEKRAPLWLGGLFGALYVLYHGVTGPVASPLLGCLGIVAWLWLLPTALRAIGLRGGADLILPGLLLGLGAQVSLQTLLHGMDLVQLLGLRPTAGALVLVGLLLVTLRPTAAVESPAATVSPGWGMIALAPYLAVQITLLANLGWVQWLSGWGLQGAALLTLGGLLAGLVLASLRIPYPLRVAAGLAAIALLLQPDLLAGRGWVLLIVQALLPIALGTALLPVPQARPGRLYLWWGAGSYLAISLVLLFYLMSEWKVLWPVMAAAAVLPGLLPPRGRAETQGAPWRWTAAALALVSLAGVGLSLIPRSGLRPFETPAPAELTAMTYNIRQTFNLEGVPGPEAIARVIETEAPDLIGLQETGRGWDVAGGGDMTAWLRWRFPQYHVRYGKTEGDLVGNILMSRYPIAEWGWELYDMKVAALQRGWIWARIPTEAGDLTFVNTHLSAFRGEEADRINQARRMLRFWAERPRFVLLGDLNATPETEPMQILRQGGLVDLPGAKGLGESPTFPAGKPIRRLDYIWASPDLDALQVDIPQTTASDHLPVVIRLRIRP